MSLLSILIPSRSRPRQTEFLERCLASIAAQEGHPFDIQIVLGLDPDIEPPRITLPELDRAIQWVNASQASQAAALNVCAAQVSGDYVAILEDDDTWEPPRLALSAPFLNEFDFLSSTQLERDDTGTVIRINDFATPSGWLMTREVFEQTGLFNEHFRLHLDNEWLGRLRRLRRGNVKRAHLVESTAPVNQLITQQVRPWLFMVTHFSGGAQLVRHALSVPLINRAVHDTSGMSRIARDPAMAQRSEDEYAELRARFGHIPW